MQGVLTRKGNTRLGQCRGNVSDAGPVLTQPGGSISGVFGCPRRLSVVHAMMGVTPYSAL